MLAHPLRPQPAPQPAFAPQPRGVRLRLQELEQRTTPSAGLVRDLNPEIRDLSSDPSELRIIGSTVFFAANDGVHGRKLWKSDGTAAGTVLVKDAIAGVGASYPAGLTAVGDLLYFTADDGAHGRELWKSDGTAAGTVLVKDIRPGTAGPGPTGLTAAGGLLYFTASDGVSGAELWKSDGTAVGTVLVKDIRTGGPDSTPTNFAAVGGLLFFTATDGVKGPELWKSDGSAAGTTLVKDIYAGNTGASPTGLTAVGDRLFFAAADGVHGRELWTSDGTSAGTVLVKDLLAGSSGSYPRSLTAVDGVLYLTANFRSGQTELWRSDGTATGTTLVKEIRVEVYSAGSENLTAAGGSLFFVNLDGDHGRELWKSDGTTAGTVLVKDISDGASGSAPTDLTAAGGLLYFTASDGVSGAELWKSDGTAAGTTLVRDLRPGATHSFPKNLVVAGVQVYFAADDGVRGVELWKSDGTADGTVLVKDIFGATSGSNPASFTEINGTLFFVATTSEFNRELWKSDGTVAGTTVVKEIVPGRFGSNPTELTAVGNVLFFVANDGTHGWELWRTDGTPDGTVLVKDIWVGGGDSNPADLTVVDGTLFFTATGNGGRELWKTDGTAAGTVLVKDIRPGTATSYPKYLTAAGNTLYFTANDGVSGQVLWKTDGTAAGTVLVKDIHPGPGGAGVPRLTVVGETLYFSAGDGNGRDGLWKTDGTAAGTVLVYDGGTGSLGLDPRYLTAVGGVLYFTADDGEGVHGRELWKSDGTPAGTLLVKNIDPKDIFGGPGPLDLTAVGDLLYFTADDRTHGRELWKTDGTAAGTVLVKDLAAGSTSSSPRALTAVEGSLYFVANDWLHPVQLWRIAATESDPVMQTGPELVTVTAQELKVARSGLYFAASTPVAGNELWALPLAPPVITSPAAVGTPENRTAVLTIAVTAAVPALPLTFSITGGADAARFAVDAATGQLRFVAAPNFEVPTDADGDNVYEVVIHVSDGTLTDTRTFTITVADENEAPAFTGGPFALSELTAPGALVGTLHGTDPDAGDVFAFSLTAGAPDNALFVIAGNELRTNAVFDYESRAMYSVRVRVTDAGGLTFEDSITVSITDANEPPTFTGSSSFAVPENAVAVSTVTAADQDIGASLTFAITGGTDATRFAIDATTGQLRFVTAPNFEAPTDTDGDNVYEVVVSVSDGTLTDTRLFTVGVTDANEAPVLTGLPGPFTAEGTTAVGTATATDPDAVASLTFSITGGADASRFSIDAASGELRFNTNPDYEIPADADGDNEYEVMIRVSDGSLDDERLVNVAVADVNEAPAAGGGPFRTWEHAPAGTVVGTVIGTDPDAGDSLTFALVEDAGGRFAIDPATGTLTVVASRWLEPGTSHTVVVRVMDAAGLFADGEFVVSVDAVPAPPRELTVRRGDGTLARIDGDGKVVGMFAPPAGYRDFTMALRGDAGGGTVVIGSGSGVSSKVALLDGATGAVVREWEPFGGFAGGVNVAAGDVTGDGVADIVAAAGAGGGPHVKVFDGATGAEVRSFFAFGEGFSGGVSVAVGDVDGDGYADIVVGAGIGGGPHVAVYSGKDGAVLASYYAYDEAFTGGVRVAVGDLDENGLADVVTGTGPGGGPNVRVFAGPSVSLVGSFLTTADEVTGGVRVAVRDVRGDGRAELATFTPLADADEANVYEWYATGIPALVFTRTTPRPLDGPLAGVWLDIG